MQFFLALKPLCINVFRPSPKKIQKKSKKVLTPAWSRYIILTVIKVEQAQRASHRLIARPIGRHTALLQCRTSQTRPHCYNVRRLYSPAETWQFHSLSVWIAERSRHEKNAVMHSTIRDYAIKGKKRIRSEMILCVTIHGRNRLKPARAYSTDR